MPEGAAAAGPAADNDRAERPRPDAAARAGARRIDTLLQALIHLSAARGRALSESEIRAACPIPRSGMTTGVFLQAARRLGYRTRRIKPDPRDLAALPTPFVGLGSPETGAVVVTAIDGDQAEVFTPTAMTTGRVALATLAAGLVEVILLAPRGRAGGAGEAAAGTWRALVYGRVRGVMAELLLASLIINLFALASPVFMMTVYNKVIGQQALDTLHVMAIGMVVLYVFDFLLRAIRGYIASHTGARLDALIGSEVVHRLVHLPYRHFETTATGLISERLRQLEVIRQFFTGQMPMVIVDLAFVSLFLAVLYYLHPVLGLLVAGAIPVFVAVSALFHRAQKQLVEDNFTTLAAKTSTLAETVANALTMKALGLESEIERRWSDRLAISAWTGFRANNLANIVASIGSGLQHLASLAVIYAGAMLAIDGALSVGALIAATILTSRALAPMRQVVSAWAQLQSVRAAFRRLDDIMAEAPNGEPGAQSAPADIRGGLEIEAVSYTYETGQPDVLSEVALSVAPGEIVCIMGPSGSGKSTLGKIAQGLYKPTAGRVLVDGTDIAHISPHDLRHALGVMPQEVQLFAGTIGENIAIGMPDADHDRVVAAARFVGAHGFIQDQPKGYDTQLGERGGGLSVGQRQLICVARALMRNPQMLILDEPTSALDHAAELHLLKNLRNLADRRTVVIISHRPAPAKIADRVVVMEGGRVKSDRAAIELDRAARPPGRTAREEATPERLERAADG